MNKFEVLQAIEGEIRDLEAEAKWPGWTPWAALGAFGVLLSSVFDQFILHADQFVVSCIALGGISAWSIIRLWIAFGVLSPRDETSPTYRDKTSLRTDAKYLHLHLLHTLVLTIAFILVTWTLSLYTVGVVLALTVHLLILALAAVQLNLASIAGQPNITRQIQQYVAVLTCAFGLIGFEFFSLSFASDAQWESVRLGLMLAATLPVSELVLACFDPNVKISLLRHIRRRLQYDLILPQAALVAIRRQVSGASYLDFVFDESHEVYTKAIALEVEMAGLIDVFEVILLRTPSVQSLDDRVALSRSLKYVEDRGVELKEKYDHLVDVAEVMARKIVKTMHLAKRADFEVLKRDSQQVTDKLEAASAAMRKLGAQMKATRALLDCEPLYDLFGGPKAFDPTPRTSSLVRRFFRAILDRVQRRS